MNRDPVIETRQHINAKRTLEKLGYKCDSTLITEPGANQGEWAHVVSDPATGRLLAASIHPDVFQSLAISRTLVHLDEISSNG